MITKPYPWQTDQWQRLQSVRALQRLPHALMFSGQAGIGVEYFAHLFAQSLFCETPDAHGYPCGQCQACRLVAQSSHPDFRQVMPEEDKQSISVDQLRALQSFLQSSASTGRKVAIIDPADKMTHEAANSLLKILEEPPGASHLILVTAHSAKLPATVRSRCQPLNFHLPEQSLASQWLRQQGVMDAEVLLQFSRGAPLSGFAMSEEGRLQHYRDALKLALEWMLGKVLLAEVVTAWKALSADALLSMLLSLIRDLVRARSAQAPSRFENQPEVQVLQKLAGGVDLEGLFQRYDALLAIGRSIHAPLNPDLLRTRMALTLIQA